MRAPPPAPTRRPCRPRLEPLEDRLPPTVSMAGVSNGGAWTLDSNNSGRVDADLVCTFRPPGPYLPVAGDWNGDGRDDVGVFRAGLWILDSNGSWAFDSRDRSFTCGAGGTPVVGAWL